jgi:hypothetical protein
VSHTSVMYLGGRLDHAIREVPASDHTPAMPGSDTYRVPGPVKREPGSWYRPLPDPDPYGEQLYYRHKVDLGHRGEWWVYILEGYSPSMRDLIDTCPFLYV